MREALAVFLIVAFCALALPVSELAAAGRGGTGTLAGHIYDEDMRTPVRNAVVVLRNLITQEEYWSDPTDPEGLYLIGGLEEGRYIMGVKSPTGSYNFHYSLLIKSDALAKLSVAMKPGGDPVMLQQGYDQGKKKNIVDFFKSPAGIVTLLTAVEVTLFAFVLIENEASPVNR